ncbi:SAF domain-containing protein [Paenibacillus gansuensis]|uniref:SAF domain-containing protein n=1 Tax=Paenibacillus gansuensis TaxID=306542 RepID=A0ABW5PGC9_9BACL
MHKWITAAAGLLIMAGSVAAFIYYMKGYEQDLTTMVTYKPKAMIYAGDLVTESMIRKVPIPVMQHAAAALTDKDEIIGKRAAVPIGESEEFAPWKLTADDVFPQQGESYYGFEITGVQAVNNMIRRGDRVDVWVELNPADPASEGGEEKAPVGAESSVPRLVPVRPTVQNSNEPGISTHPSSGKPLRPSQPPREAVQLLLQQLKVASVKDAEGNEIRDEKPATLGQLKGLTKEERDRFRFEGFRSTAEGAPAFMTFIMSPEQYDTFIAGKNRGTLRLGLNNPFFIVDGSK